MISLDYAATHLRGIWRLAVGDENWRDELDITTEGVFASLWAIAFAAPFAILGVITDSNIAKSAPAYQNSAYAKIPLAVILPTELLSSLIGWLITLAVLGFTARRLGQSRNAAGLIISYNWSQLLAFITILAPACTIALTGNAQLSALIYLGIFVFSIYLFWVVLRRNIEIDVSITIALIVGLFALSLGVSTILLNAAHWLNQLAT